MTLLNFFQGRSGGVTSHGSPPQTSLMELVSTEDWKLAEMELAMNPREASQVRRRVGFFDGVHDSHVLPLHLACALHPPAPFVERLIDAYPEGAAAKEQLFKRLPIHVACQTSASVEVVRVLLDSYPDGGREMDSLGRLPIHYACSHGAPYPVIRSLLDNNPDAVSSADKNGWLPLHVACRMGGPERVIRALLDANPKTMSAKTKKGSTPLMCARKNKERSVHLVHVLEKAVKEAEPEQIGTKGIGAVEGTRRTAIGDAFLVRPTMSHALGA